MTASDGSGGFGAAAGGRALPISRRRFWVAAAASLAAFVILCGLGTWQVERLFWKEALIQQIEERTRSNPVDLAEIERRFAATGDVEYTPMQVRGRFLHKGERHFLATFEGEAGWYVYAPLQLGDGRSLFVNRGFVPYARKDSSTRTEGLADGEVTLTGLARNPLSEKPSSMMPDNDTVDNVFFWKSMSEMATGLPPETSSTLLPFFFDAGPGAASGGYPVGGVTVVELPNSHLQYAFTWFGLAAVLLVMFVLSALRSRRTVPDVHRVDAPAEAPRRPPQG
ncbi:MAG: SURF1 family protein [Rhizobiaceae bacterium]|nr:SURF1 family protein [Rhizobiaceae bacterium]